MKDNKIILNKSDIINITYLDNVTILIELKKPQKLIDKYNLIENDTFSVEVWKDEHKMHYNIALNDIDDAFNVDEEFSCIKNTLTILSVLWRE